MGKYKKQIRFTDDILDENFLKKYLARYGPYSKNFGKPNGVWTSSLLDDEDGFLSSWHRFGECDIYENSRKYIYKIKVSDSAKILKLTEDNVYEIFRKYHTVKPLKNTTEKFSTLTYLDINTMREDGYNGLHMATRFDAMSLYDLFDKYRTEITDSLELERFKYFCDYYLYSFYSESSVFWDWVFDDVVNIHI